MLGMMEWLDWERKMRHALSFIFLICLLGFAPSLQSERTVFDRDKPTPAGRSPPVRGRPRGAGLENRASHTRSLCMNIQEPPSPATAGRLRRVAL